MISKQQGMRLIIQSNMLNVNTFAITSLLAKRIPVKLGS